MNIILFRSQHPSGVAFSLALAGLHTLQVFVPVTFARLNAIVSQLGARFPVINSVHLEHFVPSPDTIRALSQIANEVYLYPDVWPLTPAQQEQLPSNVIVELTPAARRPAPSAERAWRLTPANPTPPDWMISLREGYRSPLWPWLWAQVNAEPYSTSHLVRIRNAMQAAPISGDLIAEHRTVVRALIHDQLDHMEGLAVAGVSGVALNLPVHLHRTALADPLLADRKLLMAWACRRGQASGILQVEAPVRAEVAQELENKYRFHIRTGPHSGGDGTISFTVTLGLLGMLLRDSHNVIANMNR